MKTCSFQVTLLIKQFFCLLVAFIYNEKKKKWENWKKRCIKCVASGNKKKSFLFDLCPFVRHLKKNISVCMSNKFLNNKIRMVNYNNYMMQFRYSSDKNQMLMSTDVRSFFSHGFCFSFYFTFVRLVLHLHLLNFFLLLSKIVLHYIKCHVYALIEWNGVDWISLCSLSIYLFIDYLLFLTF